MPGPKTRTRFESTRSRMGTENGLPGIGRSANLIAIS